MEANYEHAKHDQSFKFSFLQEQERFMELGFPKKQESSNQGWKLIPYQTPLRVSSSLS